MSLAAFTVFAPAAGAQIATTYTATLGTGTSLSSFSSGGTGTVTVTVSPSGGAETVSGSYSGLTGNATTVDFGVNSAVESLDAVQTTGGQSGTFGPVTFHSSAPLTDLGRTSPLVNAVIESTAATSGEIAGWFGAPPAFSLGSLTLVAGASFTETGAAATGYPTPTLAESGTLPAGMTFSGTTLSGTPAAGSAGTYTATYTATNASGTSTSTQTITVEATAAGTSYTAALGSGTTLSSFSSSGSGTITVTASPDGTTDTVSGSYSGLTGTATTVDFGLNSTVESLDAVQTTGGTAGIFGPVTLLRGTPFTDLGRTSPLVNAVLESTADTSGEIGGWFDTPPGFSSFANVTLVAGSPFSETGTVSGYPSPTVTESGTLPAGMTFTGTTLSGTPAADSAGTYPVTYTATNATSATTYSQTITVDATATGTTYTATLGSGTALSSFVSSGTATVMVTLSPDATTYTVSGSYSGLTGNATTLDFGVSSTVETLDAVQTTGGTSGTFGPVTFLKNTPLTDLGRSTPQVNAVLESSADTSGEIGGWFGAPPAFSSFANVTLVAGSSFSESGTVTGYPTPTVTESGTLPAGMTFTGTTLSGTPGAGSAGSYPVTYTATNATGPAANYSQTITVDPPATGTTFTATLGSGTALSSFSSSGTATVTVTLSPDATTYTVSGSYSGLTGNATTVDFGVNSTVETLDAVQTTGGTSGTFGPVSFLRVGPFTDLGRSTPQVNAVLESSADTSGEIGGWFGAPPAFSSFANVTLVAGSSFSETGTLSGYPTPTVTESGTLPAGMTFTGTTLSGTPAAGSAGSYPVTYTATNATGPAADYSQTITVNGPPVITSASSLTLGVGESPTLVVATNSTPSAAITEVGALPTGITLSDQGNGTADLLGAPASGTEGTYPITITADNGFAPAATQVFTLTVSQGSQSLNFTSPPPSSATYGGYYLPTVSSSGSGIPVVLSVDGTSTAGACSYAGGEVSFTGVGTCVIDANEAGSTDYAAAPQVQQSFTISQATQSIEFTSAPPPNLVYGDSYAPTITNDDSPNPVVISVDPASTAGACTYSRGTVNFTGVGTCTLDGNQTGSAGYLVAPQVQQSMTISQAPQSLAFTSSAPFSPAYGDSYSPTVSGGASGNPVVVSVDPSTSSACSYSSGTVSFTGVGPCLLDANQAGNADYVTATQIQQSFTIRAIAPTAPNGVAASAGNASATISWSPPASDGGAPVTGYTVSANGKAVCTTSGATSCTVRGLTNGQAYTFIVTATNALGTGPSATAGSVTPSGPAPSLPPDVPAGSLGSPMSATTSPAAAAQLADSEGSASATVSVPAGALPSGTLVSLYPVTKTTSITSALPAGQSYLASFALSWQAPDGSVPTATSPLTMTIRDPAIAIGDVIYELTAGGVRAVGRAFESGLATVTFTNDPAFVIAITPQLSLRASHLLLQAGSIPVALACTNTTCRGTVSLDQVTTVRVKHGKTTTVEKKSVILARAAYRLAAGSHSNVRLAMTAAGRQDLSGVAHSSQRLVLSITTVGGSSIEKTIVVS